MSPSTGREMPAFDKSPPELVERFDAVAGRHPEAKRKPMFGYPALFVGGNYATGLFRDRWVVRLSEADHAEALALPGVEGFSPMPGRAMKGWAALPSPESLPEALTTHSRVKRGVEGSAWGSARHSPTSPTTSSWRRSAASSPRIRAGS